MNLPNLLTGLRIFLAVPFVLMIRDGNYVAAIGIYFVAGVTDFLDGYLARKLNQQTTLGRILDPLADKVLITVSYVVMAIPHQGVPSIPIWLAAAVISRDVVILIGSAVVYLVTRFKEFQPSFISKLNTVVELCFIGYFLSSHASDKLGFLLHLQSICYGIVLVTVVVSGLQYIGRGIAILRRFPNSDQHRTAHSAKGPL
jgi:cardiolipin synthase